MSDTNPILKSADQILDELFSTLKELKSAKKKKSKKSSSSSDSHDDSDSSSSSSSDSDRELKKKKKKHKKEKKKKKKHKKDNTENQNGKSRRKKSKKSEEREEVFVREPKEASLSVPDSNHKSSLQPMVTEMLTDTPAKQQTNLQPSSVNLSQHSHTKEDTGNTTTCTTVQATNQNTTNPNPAKDPSAHREFDHRKRSRSPRRDASDRHSRSRSRSPKRQSSKGSRSPGRRTSGKPKSPHQHRSPQRRHRSRSRSPHRRRRSKSRSPHRSHRRSRSPKRSRSPHSRNRRSAKSRSKSPARQRRAPSPKSPKLDKAQLLEIARENLRKMQQMGTLHPSLVKHVSSTYVPVRKSVAELTDYCKQLIEQSSEEADGADKEQGKQRNPFELQSQNEPRNAASQSGQKPGERHASKAELKQQFPVSSGQQHVALEWVPISPTSSDNEPKSDTDKNKIADRRMPRNSLPQIVSAKIDVEAAVAQRISSIRRLQEDQKNAQAKLALEEAKSMMQTWVNCRRTNPLTGEPLPDLVDWSGAPQAWASKDQFANAMPVANNIGMRLMQKMGWQPGEGLGRNKEGNLEPLMLDIKTDKKGLVSKDEAATSKAARLMNDFYGKHPVSILHELCAKKLWLPPYFVQIADMGPDHLKHFLFKVTVNGVDYRPCYTSTTKKEARAQAAIACLKALGLFPASS